MGKYDQYKVELAGRAEGKFEQDFKCDTEFFKNMENPDISYADIDVHLDGELKNDCYSLTFHCKGMLQIPCDRCLDPIDHEVDTQYHINVELGDCYDDASDDLLIIPASDRWLNTAYMLYDTVVLSIPMRHVHPLGKCNRQMASVLSRHRSGMEEDDDDIMVEEETEENNEG